MTPDQLQHRREYAQKRAARLKEAYQRKNPGKTPLLRVTIWPSKRVLAT